MPEDRVDVIPLPPLPFDGARVQRERITKQDIDQFGATIGCPGCNAIRDKKRRQAHSDRCRRRIEENLRKTPHGAERLNRREEVINEALAEEVRKGEQRRKETDGAATAASGMTAESTPTEWRENPIEPDPNPKRRMLMKSTSLTASSSGYKRERRSNSDGEMRMQTENTPAARTSEDAAVQEARPVNNRRRVIGKSEPVAVTTQEAIDGYREKARRIASVEQVELGSIMELSINGILLRWARRENLSGGVSLCKADGWNMKNHSHLTVARRLREKIHPTMLVVTIREGEERGFCSAALRELCRIIEDQIEERTVVVVAMGRHSTIWRKVNMKSAMRDDKLRYVDAEGMRVITNSQHVTEQIKIDKSESTVMDESKIGGIRRQQNLKSVAMDGVKFGKIEELENCKIDERMCRRSEEKLCKSIIKGLARRNQENTQCWQTQKRPKNENQMLYASMMSLARNCHDVKCAKLVSWN